MKQVKFKLPLRIFTLLCGMMLTATAFAQQITVNGHVKDATGEAVIGATVRIVGASGGTITDFDGNFTLNANQGDQISISYIGYEDAIVAAAPNLQVLLKEDVAQSLNEVVVIGYGVAKKNDLTGSVTAIKPDEKNHGLITSAQDMLSGKIAGVNVTSDGGTPGGSSTIRIRGGSSLNASNDPLIVIDGMALDRQGVKGSPNALSMVNPNDIESFTVLKDASATAIYGSRGSNGVIIITTKKGRKGMAPQVSYNGNVSYSVKRNKLEVLDAAEYTNFIKNYYGADSDAAALLGNADTDWQEEIFHSAVSADHNVTVQGGLKDMPYRVSLGYTDQNGILKTSNFQRTTASVTLNPSLLNDHLKFNINGKFMYSHNRYANTDAISDATRMDPTQPVTSSDSKYDNYHGYFQWTDGASSLNDDTYDSMWNRNTAANPVSRLYEKNDRARSYDYLGNIEMDYQVHGFEDLRIHMNASGDWANGTQKTDYENWGPSNFYYGNSGYTTEHKYNLTYSAYAQYYKDFLKTQHFDIMLGYEWSHNKYWGDSYYAGRYPITNTGIDEDTGIAAAGQLYKPSTGLWKQESYLVSFFGRANYIAFDRYMVTATVRRDGSSRFKEHWATFPSIALGWKISEEPIFINVNWLDELKLRLGWGKTGQQDVGNDYGWIPTYSMSTGTNGFYPITGTGVLYRPDNYTPNLKWETTETFNVGLDWGVMNQRLSGSIDWYYRKTTDLLNYAPTKPMSAFRNQAWQNIGSLKNTGIEVTVDWKAIQTKDFFWTLNGNFTYNHNEITDLSGVSTDGSPVPTGPTIGTDKYLQYNQVGYATNSFYVYQQVYDANGKAIEGLVVDRNGDGQITQDDRYFYKKPAPDVTLGLASRMEWKNWDFSFSLRANFNNYVFNNIESGQACVNPNEVWSSLKYLSNRPTFVVEDNWQTYNVEALLSDRYVHNASFLKCDNITLGYSFDRLFKSGSYNGVSGRVYATASNVFTITKYDGLDPEISGGYDNEMYPRPLSFIVGLNLNF